VLVHESAQGRRAQFFQVLLDLENGSQENLGLGGPKGVFFALLQRWEVVELFCVFPAHDSE
jgi:hypothetical protein